MGKAIVCGGSIGGLFAAAALRKAGWEVALYERSAVELAGRGAGIVTHPELIAALEAVGADLDDLGVAVHERVAFDKAGARIKTIPYQQVVTSWDRIHRLVRALLPDDQYHLGAQVTGYVERGDGVAVTLADGRVVEGDVLVGADGFRSVIRGQFLPEVQPVYAGYVVWRTLVPEAAFPPDLHAALFESFGYFLPAGEQVAGYPIAGQNNDLRPGHRRYNVVWYSPVAQSELSDYLTDETGSTHAISIPPPLVRDEIVARMKARAAARLSAPFVELFELSDRPFFTPIYDHLSPVFGRGRVALAGDAACVARPHVGMGVTKAAQDALALAEHLGSAPDVPTALERYSVERMPASMAAHARSQLLGSYIFAEPAAGANADGRNNPNLDFIMEKTAITV